MAEMSEMAKFWWLRGLAGFGTALAVWTVMEVVMTGTRGLMLALALVVAAPAAAQSRDEQRRPDPRRDDQRPDLRDRPDSRDSRGGPLYRATPRFDAAFRNGQDDGYEAGLRDGQRGERFDPIGEKRYRSGDRNYDRRYGPRDLYTDRYRDGFRRGYADGYQDGRRYNSRNQGTGWWPFGR